MKKEQKTTIEDRQIMALRVALHRQVDAHLSEIARISFILGRRSGLDELSPLLFKKSKKRR